jgi:hypothetical protein
MDGTPFPEPEQPCGSGNELLGQHAEGRELAPKLLG